MRTLQLSGFLVAFLALTLSQTSNTTTTSSTSTTTPPAPQCHPPLERLSQTPFPISEPTADATEPVSLAYLTSTNWVYVAGDLLFGASRRSFVYGYAPDFAKPAAKATFGTVFMTTTQIRSYARLFADESESVLYTTAVGTLIKFDSALKMLWQATVPSCDPDLTLDVKYDSAQIDSKHKTVWLSGVCNHNKDVVLDSYHATTGAFIRRSRLTVKTIFSKSLLVINFGLVSPDTTLIRDTNATNPSFFIGINHGLATGVQYLTEFSNGTFSYQWAKGPAVNRNPSAFTRKTLVSDGGGSVVALMQDSTLYNNSAQFLTRYNQNGGVLKQAEAWTGQTYHGMIPIHLHWTLVASAFTPSLYMTTAKYTSLLSGESFLAKYNATDLSVIGGTTVTNSLVTDVLETSDGRVIVLGAKGLIGAVYTHSFHINVYNATVNKQASQCGECKRGFYGSTCTQPCSCQAGKCHDGLQGNGHCYCTPTTHNHTCDPCPCDLTKGVCDAGYKGSGQCLLCITISDIVKLVMSKFKTLPDKWGPMCQRKCSCDTRYGICNPYGIKGTGECVYCYNKTKFGPNCNGTCPSCGPGLQCNNTVHGDGKCIPATSSADLTEPLPLASPVTAVE